MKDALFTLLSGWHLLSLMIGVFVGLVVGLLPALGGTAGMALLLPFVFGMEPTLALPLMVGMMAVTPTADTFPSVLIGIPGSNSSQATVLDGFPMSRRGEAARALSASFSASLVGGLFGAVVLTASIHAALPLILAIGFSEQLVLVMLALSMVGSVSGASALKGLATCGLGLLAGTIGTAPATGAQRLTLDSAYLIDGVPLVIVGLGLFALPEVVELARRRYTVAESGRPIGRGWQAGIADTVRHWSIVLRCSLIGVVLGALPGLGGSVVNWITYSHVVQTARDKSQFGRGDVRGVLGPESANNAQDGGALIPTLLFGIPGSGSMALLLAGFVLIGVEPGIHMVTVNIELTYLIVWSLALGNVIGAGTCVLLANPISRVTAVPMAIAAPFMFAVILFGALQATRTLEDLWMAALVGCVGVYMKRFGWPRPAFMIGFVLSGQLEAGLYRVSQLYGVSFLQRPAVIVLLLLLAVSLFAAVRFSPELIRVAPERSDRGSRLPQQVFWLAAFAFVGLVAAAALSWDHATALFPLAVAAISLLLLAPVGVALLPASGAHPARYDLEHVDSSNGLVLRSTEYVLGWLLLGVALASFLGFVAGMVVFVYGFLRRIALVKRGRATLGAACVCLALAALRAGLGVRFPAGIMETYVSLPWP